jgi:hypothetical protein
MASGSRFNVEDPRFDSTGQPARDERYEAVPVEPPRRSCLASCFYGCLITFVVLVILGGIAAYYISKHWKDWASTIGSAALKETIEATELPEQEKDEISEQIDRLAAAFRQGQITKEQMAEIVQQVVGSPLMTTLAVSAIEKKYVTGSGLNDQEKVEAHQTLRRFLRAAIDQKIDEEGMNGAMQHVARRNKDGNWELKDRVTDDELRAFLGEAKTLADDAGVPAEPEEIDPSDEFKRIIDEAMDVAPPLQAEMPPEQ